VALVVLNTSDVPAPAGRVTFRAAFPVRAEVGSRPVTVRDEAGAVVPSRIMAQSVTPDPALPPGRVLWSLTLEFAVDALPAHTGRAYAAVYADSPASRAGDVTFWEALPSLSLNVVETDCHSGDLPTTFPLS